MSSTWERFFEKVTVTPDGCWEWQGYRNALGYGLSKWPGIQTRYTHRIAYTVLVGPIGGGLTLDHLCRNPPCLNPQHLDPCTIGENLRRSPIAPAGIHAKVTHCPQGHPFSGENLIYEAKYGKRRCKACRKVWSARWNREHGGEAAGDAIPRKTPGHALIPKSKAGAVGEWCCRCGWRAGDVLSPQAKALYRDHIRAVRSAA